jgi:hypothetical protein
MSRANTAARADPFCRRTSELFRTLYSSLQRIMQLFIQADTVAAIEVTRALLKTPCWHLPAIERAVVFTNGKQIPLSVLPQSVSAFAESRHSLIFKIGTPLRELERQAIDITLQHTRGDKNLAARMLGIATRTPPGELGRLGRKTRDRRE